LMKINKVLALEHILRRTSRFSSETLSQTDREVLHLVRSRGGRIFESKLRDYLGPGYPIK